MTSTTAHSDDDCPCYGNLEEDNGRSGTGPLCRHEAARMKRERDALAARRSQVEQFLRETSPRRAKGS